MALLIYPLGYARRIMAAPPVRGAKDAGIVFPKHKHIIEEKLIRIMEITETGIEEVRIAELEKKVRDMEPLVRGLLAELISLKAFFPTMTRQNGERSRQGVTRGSPLQESVAPKPADASAPSAGANPSESSTVIISRSARKADDPKAQLEPAMARIMQADGTMKLEPRFGASNTVDTSSGSERNRKGTFPKRK
jgi:hypothetical protein